MLSYVPLWCKSNFSFLEGASHPDELMEAAAFLGLPALAITDRDGVHGVVRAHTKGLDVGVRPIIGAQVSLEDASELLLLATDRAGYADLCRLLTRGRLRCEKGASKVTWNEVCEHAAGLVALWGGDTSLLGRPVEPLHVASALKDAFGDRLYAMIARHRSAEEPAREARLRARAKRYGLETVAVVEVLYHSPTRRPLHDVLTCIRHGASLSSIGRLTRPNAEHALKTARSFLELFEDDVGSVARTHEVASRCTFSLGELRYRYPAERLPNGTSSAEWLRELVLRGAAHRYDGATPEPARAQIEKELSLICELDYCGYFLTMHEIV